MMHRIMPTAAVIAAAAIGVGAVATSANASSVKAHGAAASNKNLVLIQGTDADNFYVTMGCGAKAEAKKLGYSIKVEGPTEFSPAEQIPIVTAVTASKPAAVMIAPTDENALIKPMQAMKSAGIKVVQVDTHVSNTSIASASISSNNALGGKMAADELAKLIHDKGSVVVMNEEAGVSTTEARIQGFTALKTEYTGDNPAQAAQTITALYAAHPDLSGVFATNVLVAEGTDTGLHNTGASGKVKIVGYDADPEQVSDLKKNIVQALIAQQPYAEGVDGVEQSVNAIEGKPTKSILTNLAVLTNANLAANKKYIYESSC